MSDAIILARIDLNSSQVGMEGTVEIPRGRKWPAVSVFNESGSAVEISFPETAVIPMIVHAGIWKQWMIPPETQAVHWRVVAVAINIMGGLIIQCADEASAGIVGPRG